jgi:hypothetical protein
LGLELRKGATRIPARAARAAASPWITSIILLPFTPIKEAASGSWATERIAPPVLVLAIKKPSPAMVMSDPATANSLWLGTEIPARITLPEIKRGMALGWGPYVMRMVSSKKRAKRRVMTSMLSVSPFKGRKQTYSMIIATKTTTVMDKRNETTKGSFRVTLAVKIR